MSGLSLADERNAPESNAARRQKLWSLTVALPVESFFESVPAATGHSSQEEAMIRRAMKFAVGAAIATAVFVGTSTLLAPVQASFGGGNCICPDVYAPVKCSNGVTYSNACRASCAHAKNCVPTGNI
jgi:hypothetical protein